MKNENVRYAVGTGGRFVGVRILPNVDLILGLREVCEEVGIKSGAIISCAGSLRTATLEYAFPQPKGKIEPDNLSIPPIQDKFGFIIAPFVKLPGPLELAGLEGTILFTEGKEEELWIHVHGTVIDHYGKAYGGHLVEGGNLALCTLDIVLCEIKGVRMIRKPDPEFAGLPMLCPDNE